MAAADPALIWPTFERMSVTLAGVRAAAERIRADIVRTAIVGPELEIDGARARRTHNLLVPGSNPGGPTGRSERS